MLSSFSSSDGVTATVHTLAPDASTGPLRRIAASPGPSLAELVNTLQGTDSHHDFSTGNTLPLVVMPHGMTAWIPQTDEGRWAFDARAPKIQGFRATHQPSPWIGDYGQFLVMPTAGARPPESLDHSESFYRKEDTVAHPHYFRTHLWRHGIVSELTPTERGCSMQFTYRRAGPAWLAFKLGRGAQLRVDRERRLVFGVSTANRGGVPANFGCFFVAEIGTAILDSGRFTAPAVGDGDPTDLHAAGLWLELARPSDGCIAVKIATSFISEEQALLNLRREIGAAPFEATRAAAKTEWDRRLGVIAIEGASEDQRRTFYGCLFRCFVFPRMWHEFDATDQRVHFSPYDGQIHDGPLYTDIGFWDVHRTLLPLLTLIAPTLVGDMIEGWVNAYKEGGWLPSWASPGYRHCMVGSHSNAVITDAFRKGIANFDIAAAYAAVRQDAMIEPPSEAFGRAAIADYIRLGYVPADRIGQSVARTTDYAHCDYAAAEFARALGRKEDYHILAARASNYRNLYDPVAGFLRGRLANGRWRDPFSEFEWSNDYIEGGAWQHTWSVPHDAAGLIELMGGRDAFVARLDHLLAQPPRFETGHYSREIHEMTEMAAASFGQYAHSNQPVHHVLYLYTCAGRPDRTQYWVRRVVDELYTPTRFPGDEDNGEMSAWYVFNTLGFFPLTVGHPAYVLGAPRFPRATVRLENGRELVVEGVGDIEQADYTRGVEFDGQPHTALEIPHALLAAGGRLTFELTTSAEIATARGTLPPPFSLSTST